MAMADVVRQYWARLTVAVLQAVAGEAALDVVAFETVPCLKELRAISRLMRTEFPGTPAWVACSCRDAGHIAHGESLAGILPRFLRCLVIHSHFHCSRLFKRASGRG